MLQGNSSLPHSTSREFGPDLFRNGLTIECSHGRLQRDLQFNRRRWSLSLHVGICVPSSLLWSDLRSHRLCFVRHPSNYFNLCSILAKTQRVLSSTCTGICNWFNSVIDILVLGFYFRYNNGTIDHWEYDG